MTVVYQGKPDLNDFKTELAQLLQEFLEKDESFVYLDADLMSCIGMVGYKHERAINCGVAEANMIGVAAGLAAGGFRPLVHSFGPFASRRVYDQVFLSAAYAGNDITVIGSDPGVCAAFNGGTHMPFEDIALYRAIPGATILDITDVAMLKSILPQCLSEKGLKYLRLDRKAPIKVYQDGTDFKFGQAKLVKAGKDIVIIASGIMVAEALLASQSLEQEGISVAVLDPVTIKPLDEKAILEQSKLCKHVIVAENHNKIGGLYSAVCESLLRQEAQVKIDYVAVDDCFGEVGDKEYLQSKFKLRATDIIQKAKKILK